jgi:hypothetical protein
MRDGNFNNVSYPNGDPVLIFDFDGLTPFPNNTIPADRINRVAPVMLQYYPLPNHFDPNVGGLDVFQFDNYQRNVPAPILSDQFDVRIDHTFNSKQSVFGRWTFKHTDTTVTTMLLLPSQEEADQQNQVVLAHSYAITPNLISELRGGISHGSTTGTFPVDGPALMADLALNDLGPFPQGGFPHMFPGFWNDGVERIFMGGRLIFSPTISRSTKISPGAKVSTQ